MDAASDNRRSETSRCSAIQARPSKTVRGRALAVHPPDVDGGDGGAEVGRQFGDVYEWFRAPGVGACRGRVLVTDHHTQKVRTAIPDDPRRPQATSSPRAKGASHRL